MAPGGPVIPMLMVLGQIRWVAEAPGPRRPEANFFGKIGFVLPKMLTNTQIICHLFVRGMLTLLSLNAWEARCDGALRREIISTANFRPRRVAPLDSGRAGRLPDPLRPRQGALHHGEREFDPHLSRRKVGLRAPTKRYSRSHTHRPLALDLLKDRSCRSWWWRWTTT